jgi:hypothetical protein
MAEAFVWNRDDLEKIYLASRLVFRKEISPEKAAEKLAGIIGHPQDANMVFFDMYIHMKAGRIFRESGGDEVIVYFMKRIAEDDGEQALSLALKSVYGYTGFRESVGCNMTDLNRICSAIEKATGVKPFGV